MPPNPVTPRRPSAPQGIGLYIRAMSDSTIERRVAKMADHGVRWAMIGGPWFDRKKDGPVEKVINPPERCRRIADTLNSYGLDAGPWGYPARGAEALFARRMNASCTPSAIATLIDPELAVKAADDDEDGRIEPEELEAAVVDAQALFWEMVKQNPYRPVGFTSYGIARHHRTFPWEAFIEPGGFNPLAECEWHSPQLYDQTLAVIRRGLQEYRDLGADVLVPSFGTYKYVRKPDGTTETPRLTYEEMKAHLGDFAKVREEFSIQALIGWSEAQISGGGWRAIGEFADVFQ